MAMGLATKTMLVYPIGSEGLKARPLSSAPSFA